MGVVRAGLPSLEHYIDELGPDRVMQRVPAAARQRVDLFAAATREAMEEARARAVGERAPSRTARGLSQQRPRVARLG